MNLYKDLIFWIGRPAGQKKLDPPSPQNHQNLISFTQHHRLDQQPDIRPSARSKTRTGTPGPEQAARDPQRGRNQRGSPQNQQEPTRTNRDQQEQTYGSCLFLLISRTNKNQEKNPQKPERESTEPARTAQNQQKPVRPKNTSPRRAARRWRDAGTAGLKEACNDTKTHISTASPVLNSSGRF